MSTQENISIVRKLFALFDKNDTNKMNAFDEMVAPNVQIHDPAIKDAKGGLQAFKQAESSYMKAFPNKTTKIDNIFAADDQVVVHWTVTGTQKGQFNNIAPTNKNFKITGISIYKLNNKKVVEMWQVWDRMGLLEQLGEMRIAHAAAR